jgi:hypothetical protein
VTTVRQPRFSSGEIAPAWHAGVDLEAYATGLRTCRNAFVAKNGGVYNRPGTAFIGPSAFAVSTNGEARLIPFIFNADQTYVLEFSHQKIRFIRNGELLKQTGVNITGVTNANPCVVTATAHGYSNGDLVYISGIAGAIATRLNGRYFTVAGATANTFQLSGIDSTNYNAYGSGGTVARVYTLTTTYAGADLWELNFAQSADVITIAHPSYPPRELSRTGHTSWAIADATFTPSIAAPGSPSNDGAAGAPGSSWVITAVSASDFEESLQSAATTSTATPTAAAPITVSWSAVSGAAEYNVYRLLEGRYVWIGVTSSTSLADNGILPDTSKTPPKAINPFGSTDNYPSCVSYIQQRRVFGNTNNNPEGVWGSRIGQHRCYAPNNPIQDADAFKFTVAGRQANEVRHLLDVGGMVIVTSAGEHAALGNEAGVVTPFAINLKQYGASGASESVRPVEVGETVLYAQARQSIVRDLLFQVERDGYRGNDLTHFATHLLKGRTVVDMAYQENPNPIVWILRDDGVLLGLTYVRELNMVAWHRHDTRMSAGLASHAKIVSVCSVPEGTEDAVYLIVNSRGGNSVTSHIERMTSRTLGPRKERVTFGTAYNWTGIRELVLLDDSLSYDGRVDASSDPTMTLSGGTDWDSDEELTLTASGAYFDSDDVGNEIHLYDTGEFIVGEFLEYEIEDVIRLSIVEYTSSTVVKVKANRTVPSDFRDNAMRYWAYAVDEVTGLWHLEGLSVAVFADGHVVANPFNGGGLTVTNGAVTLPKHYAVVHVGLPYLSDVETLDIDTPNGETLSNKKMAISEVTLSVEDSRGLWAGPTAPSDDTEDATEGLIEFKLRNEEGYDDPAALVTDKVAVKIESHWNSNGRVFIRQVDPVPMAILSIAPSGMIPFRG